MHKRKEALKPIIVSGVPRSGSTWLGKMLALPAGVHYFHEPFHPARNIPTSPVRDFFQYLPAGDDDSDPAAAFHAYLNRVLEYRVGGLFDVGNIRNARKVRFFYQPLLRAYRKVFPKRPLIKDPPMLLALPWLYEQLDAEMVIIVRHPAAFVASCKKMNWGFGFRTFLEQKELMKDHLHSFEKEMKAMEGKSASITEQACLFWKIMHYVIDGYREKYPDWIFVKHEDLSARPVEEFEKLYEKLNLDFSPSVRHKINTFTRATKSGRLVRDSKKNIAAWKEKLSVEEIDTIKQLTAEVWPAFYSEDDW